MAKYAWVHKHSQTHRQHLQQTKTQTQNPGTIRKKMEEIQNYHCIAVLRGSYRLCLWSKLTEMW